ncbi:MAG: acetamidase/formamidase family protein [Chloroflexi bacterium]|nr:acetamidase/formamidase family protein [Chloroflexota bacterium]
MIPSRARPVKPPYRRRLADSGPRLVRVDNLPTAPYRRLSRRSQCAPRRVTVAQTHHLSAQPPNLRNRWNNQYQPVLTIDPGDTVVFETLDASEDQLRLDFTAADVLTMDRGKSHCLTGPVAVRGADPGDVLAVHIEEIIPRTYGFNYSRPGAGGLPDDFAEPWIRALTWEPGATRVRFAPGIEIPLRPFLGVMGVAPAADGEFRTFAPGPHGGNLDNKELVAGATLYLPVWVPGALFATGDGHATQGDGEVSVTAIECGMERVQLRFELRKGGNLPRPQAETPTHFITMGLDEDLDEAARQALRDMIAYLGATRAMQPLEAYGFCSLAVDLRVTQIVNGVKGVHAMLPKSVFTSASTS